MPSQLQQDLTRVVSPYTKTLMLDPGLVTFQLSEGELGNHRLHQWQIIADGSVVLRFPDKNWKGSASGHRQDAFASLAGYYASNKLLDDEVAATMASALAQHVHRTGKLGQQEFSIRCVRFIGNSAADEVGVESPDIDPVYEADAWFTDAGQVRLLTRTEPHRSAPPIPESR